MPLEFNASLTIFLPKGDEAGDAVGLVRDPANTRPLALKNSDNKIIATAVNSRIKSVVSRHSNKIQRGFIQRRNFVTNIVELDTYARITTNEGTACDLALLAFLDFAAAFPSVLQTWTMETLAA